MDGFFSAFGFFSSGAGVLATIVLAGSIICIWDWRIALAGLFVIQVSVATFSVRVYGVSAQWAIAHILIMLLCTSILTLSSAQVGASRSSKQPGNWLLRVLAIVVVFLGWRLVNVEVALPGFPPNQVTYLISLMLCALVIIALGDNPLFNGVALLLWIIPVQLIVEVLLPAPALIAALGLLQLLIALTCGYLVLADRVPRAYTRVISTDITFPDETGSVVIVEEGSVAIEPLTGLLSPPSSGQRSERSAGSQPRVPGTSR